MMLEQSCRWLQRTKEKCMDRYTCCVQLGVMQDHAKMLCHKDVKGANLKKIEHACT